MHFDVLSRDLNVFEPHFLEASAGTGKTFAIEHLVTRLLLEGDSPLTIEQILVVTFTRAATRELKMRIRRNLLSAKEQLQSSTPSSDYLQAICQRGEDAVKMAIDRIDAALICYDLAQIYTLHGFCHRVLKEFAWEAGISMEVSDPDEKEYISHVVQIVKDHLKNDEAMSNYSPAQIKTLLRKYQSDPRKMIASLVNFASSSAEIAPIPSYAEHLDVFLKEIAALPPIDAKNFKTDLLSLLPHYKQMTSEEIPSQIDLLSEILSSKTCTEKQFDSLLVNGFFLEKMEENNQKVRAKFPDPSTLHYPGLYQRIRQTLLPPIKAARDPARIFLRLCKDLQERCRDLLEKRETFSPDSLLLQVESALKNPHFVACVRHKFRAAIVDEFQDTDPIQWNIFRELFLDRVNLQTAVRDGKVIQDSESKGCVNFPSPTPVSRVNPVYLVGDPKQSIYAFRNADVYLYLQAAKAMGPSSKKYLDTNFRSTAPLVHALNLLFSKAPKGWMNLPQSDEALEVIPVKVGSSITFQQGEVPIEFFIAADKKGRSKKFPTENMLEKKIFPYLAREIVKLNTEHGIQYHDIAILVKDRFQAQDLIDYLNECGIAASSKRNGSIVQTNAFFALIEMLIAVCSPFDMSKIKAALGGALLAWNEEDLRKKSDDPLLLDVKAKMQMLKKVLFEKGVGLFFQTMLDISWSNGTPLLQEIFARGDLPLYLDLQKLCQLLVEEELHNGLKCDALIPYLQDLAKESHSDDPRLRAPLQEEKGSVTVMTMHMSKGLEFEAVFALGISSRHSPAEQVSIKQDGRTLLVPFDPLDSDAMRSLEEIDAEKMRQLYVALTRAKRYLYIPLMIQEDAKEIEIGSASPVELFFARLTQIADCHADLYRIAQNNNVDKATQILKSLGPLIGYRILDEAPVSIFNLETETNCQMIPPSPLKLPLYHEQPLSFSSLAKKVHFFEAIKPPQDAPQSPHTLPLGSETGHLLHLVFEKIFKRKLHHPLNAGAIEQLIDEEIAFSSLEPWRPILLPWMIELLTKQLLTFSLSDIPGDQLQQEMEFLFPAERGMMKGFADLFFEYGGKYYLLDWKSNYLGPTDADYTMSKIAEAMHAHQYEMQAAIYAEALERYVKLFDNRPFSECFGGAIYYLSEGKQCIILSPNAEVFDETF